MESSANGMWLTLIICTYMRPAAVRTLLDSVAAQVRRPDEVLVVDGSTDEATRDALSGRDYPFGIQYYKVPDEDRGLTRQRNYGIRRVSERCDIVAFLDDDTVLEANYFTEIIKTFQECPDAVGVGGYIVDGGWVKGQTPCGSKNYFSYDGWFRSDGQRTVLRQYFNLGPPPTPGVMPPESHGRSVSSFPPTGKSYPVEYFMGGVAAYRRNVLNSVVFSHYFEGYGLYEDLDFCLRLSKIGQCYLNTNARLYHYHEPDGRPNRFAYGKMVVRNGWYVWRVKYESPTFTAKYKWWAITWLLATIRLGNVFSGPRRLQAFSEAMGRYYGMITLLFVPPRVVR